MDGAPVIAGIAGPDLAPGEASAFAALQPAGFFLSAKNITGPAQVRRLTDSLRALSHSPPLIAVDLTARPLAALGLAAETGLPGDPLGGLLRMLGINFHFGPRLDAGGPWGSEPGGIIDRAGVWNRALRKRGIVSAAGPFPAAGPLAASRDDLLRGPLTPFTALMPEFDALWLSSARFAGLDPLEPAFCSPPIIGALARDQLGFDRKPFVAAVDGVAAALAAVKAGCDLVLAAESEMFQPMAGALASVPRTIRFDAADRIVRLRDRLYGPTPWSGPACDALLAGLESALATGGPPC